MQPNRHYNPHLSPAQQRSPPQTQLPPPPAGALPGPGPGGPPVPSPGMLHQPGSNNASPRTASGVQPQPAFQAQQPPSIGLEGGVGAAPLGGYGQGGFATTQQASMQGMPAMPGPPLQGGQPAVPLTEMHDLRVSHSGHHALPGAGPMPPRQPGSGGPDPVMSGVSPLPPHVQLQSAPPMQPTTRPRPAVELSLNLVSLYRSVNEKLFARQRMEGTGPKYNDGFDDRDGHYLVIAGEEIHARYVVMEVLGKGSFGTVVKCFDLKRREHVALKITRNGRNFRHQAATELDIVQKLNRIPGMSEVIVQMNKAFEWKGHFILVFELLSYNLYQLIQCTKFNGVSLDLTRKFALQLLQVLRALDENDPPVLHCDLKPENVLLKYNTRSGIRVIDFGSACYDSRKPFKYIQSRFYRAPEVILHLPYSTQIDRWSLGCMLVELHTGQPLFDGRSEAQQLARFVSTFGPFPRWMVAQSPKRDSFFTEVPVNYTGQVHTFSGVHDAPGQTQFVLIQPPRPMTPLRATLGVTTGGPGGRRRDQDGHSPPHYEIFADFVERLLALDPQQRTTVQDAQTHPFLRPPTPQAPGQGPPTGVQGPTGVAAQPSIPPQSSAPGAGSAQQQGSRPGSNVAPGRPASGSGAESKSPSRKPSKGSK